MQHQYKIVKQKNIKNDVVKSSIILNTNLELSLAEKTKELLEFIEDDIRSIEKYHLNPSICADSDTPYMELTKNDVLKYTYYFEVDTHQEKE